ncbi:hypothetical protein HDU97_009588 [Phlyctochytrium planicorne]|nr:hypothetical protein HDU97_009588 [Phlyctochytrium planicorne]
MPPSTYESYPSSVSVAAAPPAPVPAEIPRLGLVPQNSTTEIVAAPRAACKFYAKGVCKDGSACPFEHIKQNRCRFFDKGFCSNGSDCPFLHNVDRTLGGKMISANEPHNIVGRTSLKLGPGLEIQEVLMDAASFPVTIHNLPLALKKDFVSILRMFWPFGLASVAQPIELLDKKVVVRLSSESAAEAAVEALNDTWADADRLREPIRLTYQKSYGSKILDSAYKITWHRPRYHISPNEMGEIIRRKLAQYGELKSFQVKRSTFASPKDHAHVIFADPQAAFRAYRNIHQTSLPSIGTPLTLETLLTSDIIVLRTVWEYISGTFRDSLFDEVSMDVDEQENSPLHVVIKLKSNDSEFLVRAIHRINSLLVGKVLNVNGEVLWDPVFTTTEWTAQLKLLFPYNDCFIYRDSRKKQLILYGKADEQLISSEIQKALEEYRNLAIPLTKDSVRRILKFGPQKLAGLAGAEDIKVDITKCSVSILGSENSTLFVQNWLSCPTEAEESVTSLSASNVNVCDICLSNCSAEEGRTMTGCKHSFCQDCLLAKLTKMSEPFPICCMAENCKEKLDVSLIKSFLTAGEFQALVNASFKSFINGNGEKYAFCPTLGCPQIYALDTGTTVCDECNTSICTSCRAMAHEGLTCHEFQGFKDSE